MSEFKLTILGRGSALPTKVSMQPSQILEHNEKLMLIDCGEGTQISIRRLDVRISRLNDIFISHLHGDHCLGVIGLLSSFGMMGRRTGLTIHCHPEFEEFLKMQIKFFGGELGYDLKFNTFSPFKTNVIYQEKKLKVTAFPLKHSIPTSGFLFEETGKEPHLIKEKIDFYGVPISKYADIINGEDFVTENGFVIPNNQLTRPATPPTKYAYCSDTMYTEKNLELLKGVDCLYHESTFLEEDKARAKETMHSTAAQAGKFAKLSEAKKLLLGHFSSRYKNFEKFKEEAMQEFENTEIAEERKTYIFGQ